MPTVAAGSEVRTLEVRKEIRIAAPIEIAFEAVLEEIGPGSELPDGTPFPMKIEARPGGRWYRDLGSDTGHFWGHVQVIKPPTLIEICGPMFMSYAVASHMQYRLTPIAGGTELSLNHRAFGMIPDDHLEGVEEGWEHGLKRTRELAMQKFARLRAN